MPTQLNPAADALPITPVANAADATGNYVIPGNTDLVIRINNGSGVSVTTVLDDPTTKQAEGSGTVTTPSGWPDVSIVTAAGAARTIVLNKARRARFVDPATGRVNFTAAPQASVGIEVYAV